MTNEELRDALDALGIGQRGLARVLSDYTADGAVVSPTTVNRWCKGQAPVPAAVALAVTLWLRLRRAEADLSERARGR